MFTTKKIALVSVINDLVTDNRVNKTCNALIECNYHVVLIGRRLPDSLPLPHWPFKAIRMRLFFRKGPLFYVFFNIRLFFTLLFKKADLLYANDLDTLLPNYLIARLKKIPLIYDSHELFCEVPELQHSPFKKRIWLKLEGWIVPRLNNCITVNESIAEVFSKKYKVAFHSIRNISDYPTHFSPKSKEALNLPEDKKILILQGAGINIDRGAEELIEAMGSVKNALLLIIGGGDVWPFLEKRIKETGLSDRVKLIQKIPKQELMHYTALADLGLTIDKNTNLNYYYSLPNKIFDYIHAEIPVLASRLPEIEKIITGYGIGDFIKDHQPETISDKINDMLQSPRLPEYKANTRTAKENLNWFLEKQKLIQIIQTIPPNFT